MKPAVLVGVFVLASCGSASPGSGNASTGGAAGAASTTATATTGATSSASSSGAGGTTGVSQQDLYQSGSRIKAKVLTTPDGAKSFETWYDAQLQVDCSPVQTFDGQTRCIPTGGYTYGYWSDPGCTVLLYQGTCSKAPTYAYGYLATGSGCSTSYSGAHVYTVGNAYSGTVYEGTPASCSQVPASTISTLNWTFNSLTEIEPSQFVAWTESVE
jgi:hypothetical protein